jgi:hypothetical protein
MEKHDHLKSFPDRNERLGFDMEEGNVRFEDMEASCNFTQYDEMPAFERIVKRSKSKKTK